MIKGYKVFDSNWNCNGYSFATKSGEYSKKIFKQKGKLELCSNGFHFCRKLSNCFNYYSFDANNKVAEIEIVGEYIGNEYDKECTNEFKILRELSWTEVLVMCNIGNNCSGHSNTGNCNSGDSNSGHSNTGNWNSGNRNSGNSNSGDRNSGHCNSGNSNSGNRNSGNWNSGHSNSGDWNSGDGNSGFLNTDRPDKIRVFNQLTKKTDIDFPDFFYLKLTKFVSHDSATEEEREKHRQDIEICGGFIKTLDYKEAWKLSYKNASEEDKAKVKKIPGFDKYLFFEISGIMIDE